MGGYGNVVEIEHSRSIMTVYGHLSRFAKGTRSGAHVTQGTVIAFVGMTGLATGPHLHYEYRVNGVFKNPQTVALPAAAPIDARWRDDFLATSGAAAGLADVPPPGVAMPASRRWRAIERCSFFTVLAALVPFVPSRCTLAWISAHGFAGSQGAAALHQPRTVVPRIQSAGARAGLR